MCGDELYVYHDHQIAFLWASSSCGWLAEFLIQYRDKECLHGLVLTGTTPSHLGEWVVLVFAVLAGCSTGTSGGLLARADSPQVGP